MKVYYIDLTLFKNWIFNFSIKLYGLSFKTYYNVYTYLHETYYNKYDIIFIIKYKDGFGYYYSEFKDDNFINCYKLYVSYQRKLKFLKYLSK